MNNAPIIVAYDGSCGLCHSFVRFLLRHDKADRLRFAASDSMAGSQLFASSGQDPADPMAMVAQTGSVTTTGADAAIIAIAGLGGLWRTATIFRLVPAVARAAVYRYFARHRIAWFGRASGCPAPQPEWKARFLP